MFVESYDSNIRFYNVIPMQIRILILTTLLPDIVHGIVINMVQVYTALGILILRSLFTKIQTNPWLPLWRAGYSVEIFIEKPLSLVLYSLPGKSYFQSPSLNFVRFKCMMSFLELCWTNAWFKAKTTWASWWSLMPSSTIAMIQASIQEDPCVGNKLYQFLL